MFSKSFLRRLPRSRASRTRTGVAIISATVLVLGLGACAGPGSASSSSSSEAKSLRLGIVEGRPATYNVGVVKEVLTEMGYKLETVTMPWDALIPSLQSGKIDVSGGDLWITPARCKNVAFSEPIAFTQNSIAVPKGNPHNIKTLADAARGDLRVGVESGSDSLRQAQVVGVKPAQISTYPDLATLLDALIAGRIDLVPYQDVELALQLVKPAYASSMEMTPATYPVFDDGVQRPYASGVAFNKNLSDLAKQYSEKQTEFFKEQGAKATAMAKEDGLPATGVPKGDESFKMAEYCAHAGA